MNASGKPLPPVEQPDRFLNFDMYGIISSQIQRFVQFLEKTDILVKMAFSPMYFICGLNFATFGGNRDLTNFKQTLRVLYYRYDDGTP